MSTQTNLQYINRNGQLDSAFKRDLQRQMALRTVKRVLRGSIAATKAIAEHMDREANPHKYLVTH